MLADAAGVSGAGHAQHSPSRAAALRSSKIPGKIPFIPPELLKGDPVLTGVCNERAGVGIISVPEAQAPLALLFLSLRWFKGSV